MRTAQVWLELRMAGGFATGLVNASPHPPIFDLNGIGR